MNCENLLHTLGFECAEVANGALRLWSPFMFEDGEHLGLYLEPDGANRWVVTDYADTLMHASARGARLTKNRLDKIQRHCPPRVLLTSDGALMAKAEQDTLPEAITSVLSVAIAISHEERRWVPKVDGERFTNQVGRELDRVVGQYLLRHVQVRGASGHQLEFPFAVTLPDSPRQYIQPIASSSGKIDWASVYKAGGKMLDLRTAADTHENQRVVIIEDLPEDKEVGKAATYLSSTATVLRFSRREQWLRRFRQAA